MPIVPITKETKWECQRCGECCRSIIISQNNDLSIAKDGKIVCKFLDGNVCFKYNERPFICRLYPFVIEPETMVDNEGIARPQKAFLLEHMKIHTECCGFGNGKRALGNKSLQKQFDKLGLDFAKKFKQSFEEGKDISEMI